jgi:hypothetical protein
MTTDTSSCSYLKSALWTTGSFASIFIPVPGLNGAGFGGAAFMAIHELLKTNTACKVNQPGLLASRTWKQLATGAAIAAAGGAVASAAPPLLGLGFGGGLVLAFKVAYYSDECCWGKTPVPPAEAASPV